MTKKLKVILAAIGLTHSSMEKVALIGQKLGLKVEYYRDLKDYQENINNKLFKFPVIMRQEILLKLHDLIEGFKKSRKKTQKQDSVKSTVDQENEAQLAVQIEKSITLLHGLSFTKEKEVYAYLQDAEGNERRVKLTIENA